MQNWFANTILKRKTLNTAQITTMVVPVKIPPIMIDNLKLLVELTLTLFILLMYIPLLYRTIYRIVFEKMSRVKETMRIMGMSDFSYWLSWWAYYTIVNTVMVTGAWAVLLINVFTAESALILWFMIWTYG